MKQFKEMQILLPQLNVFCLKGRRIRVYETNTSI